MNAPLISIGLPAFKAKFFKEALESIKSQTYTNFEVLIQDDASPEDLKSVFDEVCGGDSRFQYERNEKNSSPNFVSNWNKALARANGEFFVLASDDDIYDPHFLAALITLTRKYPHCDLFYSPISVFDGKTSSAPTQMPPEFETQIEYIYQLIVRERFTVVPNYLVRIRALRDMGGFIDLPAAWGSDWQTWCRLASHGVACTRDVLFKWRASGENVTCVDSPYWMKAKLAARRMARGLWNDLATRLVASNEDEMAKLRIVRQYVIDDFELHFVEPQMNRGPFWGFVWYMIRRYARSDCSFKYCLQCMYGWWRYRYHRWIRRRNSK